MAITTRATFIITMVTMTAVVMPTIIPIETYKISTMTIPTITPIIILTVAPIAISIMTPVIIPTMTTMATVTTAIMITGKVAVATIAVAYSRPILSLYINTSFKLLNEEHSLKTLWIRSNEHSLFDLNVMNRSTEARSKVRS